MIGKLREIIQRSDELTNRMAEPGVAADPKQFASLAKELSELTEITAKARIFIGITEKLSEDEELLKSGDPELKELVQEEIPELRAELTELEEQLKILLLPKDPNDNRNTILEIRSGTGGDEAALFAGDLYRMYNRYAERRNWTTEVLSLSETEAGGLKEIIVSVSGVAKERLIVLLPFIVATRGYKCFHRN